MDNYTEPREGECPSCKWVNGHRSWCVRSITEQMDALAERIPNAERVNTGGGIWCVHIPITGSMFGPEEVGGSFALVSEDFTEEGTWALGVYSSQEDEGTILKEWERTDADSDATIVGVALFTWTGGEW